MSDLASVSSASKIQTDYMKLLITQLQNQNPLDPMDNKDMASQLTQFSQLSLTEGMNENIANMNSNFAEVLSSADRSYANSLIGRKVTFFMQDEDTGDLQQMEGVVDSSYQDPDTGDNLLGVKSGEEEYTVSVGSVVLVQEQEQE